VIVAFVLIGYVWIVGWIPSLLRALVLLILLTVGEILDRGTVAEISLARCTVVVAVVSPTLLSEAGFILSILALIGLFTLAPVVAEALGLIVPGPAAGWLAAPVGALAATAPFSLLTFGSVYPVGILSAGVLALLVVAIMWGSMLYLVVATVPYLGTALIAVIDGGVRLLLALCRLFALVPGIGPGSGAGVAQTAGWCTLLAAIGLVVGILRSRRHRRVASALEMYDQPQLDF
jgi:predicted membrane metal-binding protein